MKISFDLTTIENTQTISCPLLKGNLQDLYKKMLFSDTKMITILIVIQIFLFLLSENTQTTRCPLLKRKYRICIRKCYFSDDNRYNHPNSNQIFLFLL